MTEAKYLIKVRKYNMFTNDYVWSLYRTNINPLFVMGEIIYRSMEHIQTISWSHWNQSAEDFWSGEGVEIRDYHSKYWGKKL